METILVVALSFVGLYIFQRLFEFRKAINSVGNFPGYRLILSPTSIIARLLPRHIPGVGPWKNMAMTNKFQEFQNFGWNAFTLISAWPRARTFVYLADAAAIKEVTTSRARFPKPVQQYKVLQMFGRNIVASEGDEWKKYRKIAAPAFSERNNKLVWDETVLIMLDMFKNVWHKSPEITLDHALEITLPIALFVIGVAGFGRRISWMDDLNLPPGHELTFKDALHTVSNDIVYKVICPEWALGLTKHLRKVRLAFKELDQYMLEMVREHRNAEKKEERYDLFSSLMDASEGDSTESPLTDSELAGNIFIFLLAGHETTAHTLCFSFALLALHQEEQEHLYQQVKTLISDPNTIPTYDQMPLFTYSMAVFYETLRLFPPVVGIPKESAEDTSLVIGNTEGGKLTIPIPKGTELILHTVGLHTNPCYWEDPYAFKPERFLGDWPRDAFAPFSQGARACIGRRFFETEGIAIMSMLVSQYKIEIKEEPEFANETFDERKARILASKPGLTTTPVRVPLVFKRR